MLHKLVFEAYVDNLLVVGNEQRDVEEFLAQFNAVYADYGVTIGACELGTRLAHRGMISIV